MKIRILFSVALLALVVFGAVHGYGHEAVPFIGAIFTPQWIASDSTASSQQLTDAYTVGNNPAYLSGLEPGGFRVQGTDPSLGAGEFIYGMCSNATGVVLGNICEITQTLLNSGASVALVNSVQQWAGTANSGKTLCVALTTLAQNQFGWFQVYGAAVVKTSAAVAVGANAYWNALGVIQSGAVASKQMVGASCVVASNAAFGLGVGGVTPTLGATQAVYFINGPSAQSAIT